VWGASAWVTPVAIEALIGLGRLRDAQHALAQFEGGSEARWVHAFETEILRARALVAAAEGDIPGATELIESAVDASRRRGARWELARIQLAAGEIHRRARRRAKARAALADAVQLFKVLGAALWVVRAGEELERTGTGRDDERGLTVTQLQVAQLAASGMTNREIADRLFMSVHTVEAHLSSVYRSLDIGSRRDLAGALRQIPDTIRDSGLKLRDSVSATDTET
jgi:DNA-binding CsgD family transcriptional regulator